MTLSLDDPVPDVQTTTELLHIAMGGDPAAWEKIVRRFEPAVAAMINTYRLQEADADKGDDHRRASIAQQR